MHNKQKNMKKPLLPKTSSVTLALQLTSGERLLSDFKPEVSLWEILEYWEKQGKLAPSLNSISNEVPTCIFLRKEIAHEEYLRKTTLTDLGLTSGKAAVRYITKPEGLSEQPHVGGILLPPSKPLNFELQSISDSSDTKLLVEPNIALEEIKVGPNIHEQEDVEAVQLPICSEKCDKFTDQTQGGSEELSEQTSKESFSVAANKLEVKQEHSTGHLLKAVKNRPGTEAKVNDNESTFEGNGLNYLNESGFLVYLRSESDFSLENRDDESDDFFELTEEDIRKRMHELTNQRNQLMEAPFFTAQQRAEQERDRQMKVLQRYPLTVLRVQFVDGFILQMPLPTESTINQAKLNLLNFITGGLKENDFELFTAPPKNVLDVHTPLHLLGLTPSSHVYISSNCTIKEEYRLSPSSFTAALQDAYSRICTQDSARELVSTETRVKRYNSETKGNVKAVPKWFKLNKN